MFHCLSYVFCLFCFFFVSLFVVIKPENVYFALFVCLFVFCDKPQKSLLRLPLRVRGKIPVNISTRAA